MAKDSCILDEKAFREVLINNIARRIISDVPDLSDLLLIGIYTRGVYLAKRIASYIKRTQSVSIPVGEIDINLYRDDFVRRFDMPKVKQTSIPVPVEDRQIVLVDDVIFTGRTVRAALDAIVDLGRPKCIKLAVLVDRPQREMPIHPDFVGIKLEEIGKKRVYVEVKEVDGRDRVVIR